ncbi:polynucleotide 5'-hydroxyl-kinase NOL9 [Aricia agestis]|uniref:polynucleotide 5'-hydroxyl-kinase NOL9 n=1 Tax=Aricia agestis TaxID=91739 RepID=UPI001C20A6F9|nr:polynucleotide 5'-hydroxyl-kinase NOL9 [Aricia agestis]
MEFFEKAHVVKDASKEKKSEVIKKQFKQMLYGYKNSNNQMIKDSVNVNTDFDDSSSVSGFSDLNITNSSDEEELGQSNNNTEEMDDKPSADYDNTIGSYDRKSSSESGSSTDSIIKEFNDAQDDSNSVLSEAEASLGSYVDTSSECSESFDPNGELAEKILSRLNRKEMKRKHQIRDDFNTASEVESVSDLSNTKKKRIIGENRMSNFDRQILQDIEEEAENSDSADDVSANECTSPPFISILAADMPCQSFDEVVGDYKHSTNKNLSLETGETVSAPTDIFTEENMDVVVHTEEDASSLVPELDEELTVDDIVDLESSELCDDSINILETTMESPQHNIEQNTDEELLKNLNIFYTSNKCVIVLKHPMELYVQGKVRIQALGGKVEVFGYTLQDKTYNLYAPYYSYAQTIKTVANENCYYGLFGKLTKSGLTVAEAENIVTNLGTNDAVICLEQLQSQSENFVETNFTLSNLFVKPFKHNDQYLNEASDKMGCTIYALRPRKYFVENPIWSQSQQLALKTCSRGVVCGGKGVGKSTYLRYQVNKLLDKGPVLVIDLDPGQCEFTVAGNLSATVVNKPLLGPNFTHLKKPEFMLNIGIINTMDNLRRYICAVQRLVFFCNSRDDFKSMPWLINTMGMTNALGMKLMVLIIMMVKPTYLVQYNSKAVKKCFDQYLNMETVKWYFQDNKRDFIFKYQSFPEDLDYAFILVEESSRQGKSSYSLTPKDERFLNYLAYFSELVNLYKTENVLSITPYKVSLSKMAVGSNVKIKRENILKVINGKVVALCAQAQADNSRVFILSDKPLVCHGNGLVRGVDVEKELMYIVTPVPRDQLSSINCFVYADWSPDIGVFENFLPIGTAVPYCTKAHEEHRHLMMTPRRRFNPLQLLNVTRSS